LYTHQPVHHRASLWLLAILGSIALSLAMVTSAHAEEAAAEGSPNDLHCIGHISAGTPELGSEEQQVRYTFYCNGPITGYQLETNIPVNGFEASPVVTNTKNEALSDTFACGGEIPGWADNCEGSTKAGWENITGQFSIEHPLCQEPRVDPLLTVTDIYVEKGVATQAISGPFDLGRPLHCPITKYTGGTRLEPTAPTPKKTKAGKHKKDKGDKKTKQSKAKKR
jgi:hypothetical protein